MTKFSAKFLMFGNIFYEKQDIGFCKQTSFASLLHNQLVAEVLHVYNAIRGRQLAFLWIPSHVGIHGNELADTLAKFALHRDVIVDVKLPFRDLRPLVTSYVTGLWRSDWENDSTNKLQRIGASVDSLRPMMKSRREETVLTRLRIGKPRDPCTLVAW